MHLRRFAWGVLAFALLEICAGCGGSRKTYKVQGVVTLDGQPLAGATVGFLPESEDGKPASGLTGSDGIFRLQTFVPGDGALPGAYRIVVTKSEEQRAAGRAATREDMKKMMMRAARSAEESRKNKKGLIPTLYSDGAKTPFKVIVPASGKVELNLRSSGGS